MSNPLSYMQFESDLESRKKEILKEAKTEAEKLKKNWKDSKTQNRKLFGFLNRQRRDLFEEVTRNPDSTYTTREKTFTREVIEEFKSWRFNLNNEFLMSFFSGNPRVDGFDNLPALYRKHKILFDRIGPDTGSYLDRDLLRNPNLEDIYQILVEASALDDLIKLLEEIPDNNEDKIEIYFKSALDDPYYQLRGLKNQFNKMQVDDLIDFFSILTKPVKGEKDPILSHEDFIRFIKSICQDQLLKKPITPNLRKSYHPRLRRLLYDFYELGRQLHISKVIKNEYLKFAGNFVPFREVYIKQSWIDLTTPRNQKSKLSDP